MFDKEEVFYRNEDYIVRMEKIDGIEKYYIKFNMINSPESEISHDIFMLYYNKFKKPFENHRKERKRHIDANDINSFLTLYTTDDEDSAVIKYDIDAVLRTCTSVQQKRFNLHYIQDYTLTEIAKIENCSVMAVKESLEAAKEKIKKYFF